MALPNITAILIFCLATLLVANCAPKATQQRTEVRKNSASAESDKGSESNKENPEDNSADDTEEDDEDLEDPQEEIDIKAEPLPEAKQAEVKALVEGSWAIACTRSEDPNDPTNFYYYTETMVFAADGTAELRYGDFEDENCATPFEGFEDYVFMAFNIVAVKEVGAGHFYIELNITKEFDGQALQDVALKDLAMIKVENNNLTLENRTDLDATAFSEESITYTKQ